MCDKCTDIDEKVAHHREIASRMLDEPLLDRIEEMIADLLAVKELLHPNDQ